MNNLKPMLKFAEDLCLKKGKFLLSQWNNVGQLEFKDSIDFTTKYDKQVEKEIYDEIKNRYPDHGFFGEEHASLRNTNSDYVWFSDPVDGTKYYGRQVPMFTTILGLTYKNKPVLGVVYNPSSNQIYSGAKDLGSFLNHNPLKVSHKTNLIDSIISMELGSEDKEWESEKLEEIRNKAGRIRILGNATLSICWSLQGALAGYVDLFGMYDHDKKQDLIAPLSIAKEAGMEIREIKIGNKNKIICVLPNLANELEKIIKS